ncbi:hypothetical protein [Gilvibacter sediminis]|uniref:hypothetical protein n=1 Tax=Gilvibacter sediminis TaxID=379071 RepID=UPI00235103B3|nr:hypothetical protein [Gilvibacter sediminis]MDC7998433.1 hypothetical protein [Gilvibacter sediminis]
MQNYLTFALVFSSGIYGFAQIGINTDNPRQSLHIAGATGTMRVESLNYINNDQNGGDANGNGDLTDDTYPLYVDGDGAFTLELQTSGATDVFDDSSSSRRSITLSASDPDGEEAAAIGTYTIFVNRAAILEVKYGISFEIYGSSLKDVINDKVARRIENYVMVSGDTRKYGPSSKSYSSRSSNSQVGRMFNSCSTYITLPAAGRYTVSFMGLVSSNLSSDSSTTDSKSTYVEFATGKDFVYMRLY